MGLQEAMRIKRLLGLHNSIGNYILNSLDKRAGVKYSV